jgi:hypothetical protein
VVRLEYFFWETLSRSGKQAPRIKGSMKPGISINERIRTQNALMAELITACLGDKNKAIRLLEHERSRNPSLKTMEAMETALDRLCHDRGGVRHSSTAGVNRAAEPGWAGKRAAGAPAGKRGPPDVDFRMALSALLACAVVFGFTQLASKSLPTPVLPPAKEQAGVPSIPAPLPAVARIAPPVQPGSQIDVQEPHQSSEVFKCVVNGRTVYADSACGTEAKMKRLALSDASSGFSSPPRETLEELSAKRVASEQAVQQSIDAQQLAMRAETKKATCANLSRHIDWLDSSARAPQSGQVQDWIRAEKSQTQSRQFDLHC